VNKFSSGSKEKFLRFVALLPENFLNISAKMCVGGSWRGEKSLVEKLCTVCASRFPSLLTFLLPPSRQWTTIPR
jgi:hypothetical protein